VFNFCPKYLNLFISAIILCLSTNFCKLNARLALCKSAHSLFVKILTWTPLYQQCICWQPLLAYIQLLSLSLMERAIVTLNPWGSRANGQWPSNSSPHQVTPLIFFFFLRENKIKNGLAWNILKRSQIHKEKPLPHQARENKRRKGYTWYLHQKSERKIAWRETSSAESLLWLKILELRSVQMDQTAAWTWESQFFR